MLESIGVEGLKSSLTRGELVTKICGQFYHSRADNLLDVVR